MEKEDVTQTIRPASPLSDREHGTQSGDDWRPGFKARFPWIGFGALSTVVLCVVGSVVILFTSNGKSETDWPQQIAPNVLLSVMNNVANICFGIAIGNGIAIAWWRKTLKGASIHDLHRSWSFSTSLKDIVFSLKHFNIIAMAALTAKLTIIDGTLMQKATTTEIRTDLPVNVTDIHGFANKTFPITGRTSDPRFSTAGLMNLWTNDDFKIWSQSGGIFQNLWQGCDGRCFLQIPAAGFAFDCSDPTTKSIEYANYTTTAAVLNSYHNGSFHKSGLDFTPPLFEISFDAVYASSYYGGKENSSYLTMHLVYSEATNGQNKKGYYACPGTLTKQSCKLWPAVINYPVQIESYSNAHSISRVTIGTAEAAFRNASSDILPGTFNQSLNQQNGYEVVKLIELLSDHVSIVDDTSSPLSGIQLGFSDYLGGEASLSSSGAGLFSVSQDGSAQQYLTTSPDIDQCSYQYTNPMIEDKDWGIPSVVEKINQMMFSLATDISRKDPSNDYGQTQNYTAVVYRDTIHYVSHFAYMWGAVASTLVCVLLVLPVYWGFWELGRKVTLGPFEIAHAFRSPMTAEASNGTVEEVMKSVGERQITYGHIVAGEARGVLGVAEPEYVEKLQHKL